MRNVVVLSTVLLLFTGCADQKALKADNAAEKSAPAVSSLDVTLTESALNLTVDRVVSGEAQFTIVNRGEYTHGFVIRGNGFEQKIESVTSNTQTILTVSLEPGTYELFCPLNDGRGDHDQLGELAKLVVTS